MRICFKGNDTEHEFEKVLYKIRNKELNNVSVSFNTNHTLNNDLCYEVEADINDLVVLKALNLRS